MPEPQHILIATIGSLGDLYPCLALGIEMQRRGYRVTVAATPHYQLKIEAAGLDFRRMRPDIDPVSPELIRQCEDLKTGPEVLYRKIILPELRHTYADLLTAAADADILLAGELVYAAPLVAEKRCMRWASIILSPFSFFSSCDPSVMVNAPQLIHLRKAGAWAYRAGLNVGRLAVRHWSNPVRQLRRQEGLRENCDPVFRDKFSPHLVLALFSRWLAAKQPDWPEQTLQPGFVRFDVPDSDSSATSLLTQFLAGGDPPIVFTQGSTAVHNPGDFYTVSLAVARKLNRRAVLLGVKEIPAQLPPDILVLPYAPYQRVFPQAAVIVHQGGSGTTGEAMRAGRPTLVVPYGWDQPDNATRIQRLGVGLHLPRSKYSADTAAECLRRLIEDPRMSARASEIGNHLACEDGLRTACDAVEAVMPKPDHAAQARLSADPQ